MKYILIIMVALCSIVSQGHTINTPAVHLKAYRAYVPSVGDYVKPKAWSAYSFPFIGNWTDPTGNPNPYHTYIGWVNKRCLVTSLFLVGAQWYVQLNIPGTDYFVNWPVNYQYYVDGVLYSTTDFLTPTI